MTTYKIALAVLIALGVGGCVTTPPYRSGTENIGGRPQKAVLVQTPMVVNEAALHNLFAPDLAKDSPERVTPSKMPSRRRKHAPLPTCRASWKET